LIEAAVAPLLQRIVPPAGIDSVELPQLFVAVTTGVAGAVPGAAVPEAAALVQPFTVLVTVRVPAVVTVIDAVVSPVLHKMVPPAGIDSVELPQLFVTLTTGVAVITLGAAVPEAAALVQPFTVLVTVRVPAVITVMDAVVSPVLHKMVPPAGIDSVELPQLFVMLTTGVVVITFGAAVPEPAALVQPLTVLETVRAPAVVTVIDAVVSPVLHRIVPPAGIDSVELPQLFWTLTTGVAVVALGAAVPEPAALVQPFTVLVTVRVPAVVTVIEFVVSPVLQRIVPPTGIDSVELPQLFWTLTTGVAVIALAAAVPEPAALVQPFTVLVTVRAPAVVTVIEAVVSPVLQRIVPPEGMDKVELPQPFVTVTTGVGVIAFGTAVPDPAALVQPFSVLVAVRGPAVVTLIEAVVSPVLHKMEPPSAIDRVELPQAFVTVTSGVGVIAVGAAVPEPAALIQPFRVLVTV
jgi:hypothetical protein